MVQCPKYTLLKLFVSTRYTLTFYCMKIQTFHRFHALDCSHPLLICFPVRNRFKRKICCELVSSEEMCLFVVRPPYRPSLPMRKVPNPFTVKKKKNYFTFCLHFACFIPDSLLLKSLLALLCAVLLLFKRKQTGYRDSLFLIIKSETQQKVKDFSALFFFFFMHYWVCSQV